MIGYTSLIYYIVRQVLPDLKNFTINIGEEKITFEEDGNDHKAIFSDVQGTFSLNGNTLTFYKDHDRSKGFSLFPRTIVQKIKDNEIFLKVKELGSSIKLERRNGRTILMQDDGVFSSLGIVIQYA